MMVASAMSSDTVGVQARIKVASPLAVYAYSLQQLCA